MDQKSVPGTSDQVDNVSSDQAEKFLNFEDFSKFYEQFSLTIKETVSASTKIPLKQNELDYYMTCPGFKTFLQVQNDRCLKMLEISTLLKQQGIKKANINSTKLDDEERMDMIIDSNDQIIEKLGIQLDEIQGLRKKTETELKLSVTQLQTTSRNINTSWNKDMGMVVNRSLLENSTNKSVLNLGTNSAGIEIKKGPTLKPQKMFKDKIDNSYLPFVPKLRHKFNHLVPLPEIFSQIDRPDFKVTKELFEFNPELLENPYQTEIDRVAVGDCYSETDIKAKSSIGLENTPFKYIEEVEDIVWLVNHLGKNNRAQIKEIAVDLEHHNYRSFLGFTCLMQISTRYQDFIIDTIKLRHEMHRLNEIFTDWTLIKVLHGSDFDIEWLQKDFGIYVVNMFDTGQASRILQYPHFSLSYLMQKFCGITAQKQYQLADWRQRPLNEAMIRYAREDTHHLLYIYDNMRDDLIKLQQKQHAKQPDSDIELTAQISLVLEKSKNICKKTYRKPMFYTKGFLNLCQHNSHLNSKQMKALRDIYEWRDKIARESDESCEYVLKNHQLLKISELLPREIYGILALCNPLSSIVESNVHEVHEIIKKAREFTGTITSITHLAKEEINSIEAKKTDKEAQPQSVLESIVHLTTYDPNSIINCAHDLPQDDTENQRMETEPASVLNLKDILIKPPTSKDENLLLPENLIQNSASTVCSVFSKESTKKDITDAKLLKKLKTLEEKVEAIKKQIENPFQMFLPQEFRQSNISSKLAKWSLLKPRKALSNITQTEPVKVDIVQNTTQTSELMIPLKQQFKSEKHVSIEKKPKKRSKNIDFTNAIIEYNKSKVSKVNALGGVNEDEMPNENQNDDDIDNEISAQQQKLDALLQKKISDNLSILSKELKNPATSSDTPDIYNYNAQSMNKLFAKPELARDHFDPASKIKNSKHSKVNKRRVTNAITRMKNNHSLTYKKDTPGGSGNNSSAKT